MGRAPATRNAAGCGFGVWRFLVWRGLLPEAETVATAVQAYTPISAAGRDHFTRTEKDSTNKPGKNTVAPVLEKTAFELLGHFRTDKLPPGRCLFATHRVQGFSAT